MTAPPVTIPAVAVTQADGAAIKAAIAAGPKTGSVQKNPAHPGIRDGDLENGIILHEYTHGISSRLTGGVGNSCLGGNEQAGEGWSDYIALTLLLDPALDDPEGARGMGPYALFQADRHGNGIRPRPYSRNMSIQPFTYDSIKTNGWLNGASLALPHGLGHGWASVLWDMDWDLIDKYGFNRNLYAAWNTGGNTRALQYVMDGLKLQGCNPGLVVARDGDHRRRRGAQQRRRRHVHAVGDVRPPRARLQRRPGHDRPQRQQRGVRHAPGLPARLRGGGRRTGAHHRRGGHRRSDCGSTPTTATAGSTSPRRTTRTRVRSTAQTLKTVTPGQVAITPRPVPVPAVTRGGAPLSVDADGVYTYPWQTDDAWGDTCREFVLTTKTGVQHRAFFKFLAATHADTGAGGTVPATLAADARHAGDVRAVHARRRA